MNGIILTAAAMTLGSHPVTAAEKDSARLAPEYACNARYLRLDNLDKEYRVEFIKLLLVKINDVSTSSEIVPPYIVPGTDLSLVRIHTTDYGKQFATTYERLASPWDSQLVDEVAAVAKQKKVIYHPGGNYKYPDGQVRVLPAGNYEVEIDVQVPAQKRRAHRPAFWLTDTPQLQAQFNKLVERTQTSVPIVRADWFINRISAQQNRSPTGYSDFLGVKTEKDFQRLGDFDATKKLLRVEWRAAVGFSGVTTQPRALRRDGAPDSPYWRSFDFKLAVGERDPLQIFGQDIEDAFHAADTTDVASEQYILLPNDLWATGAFDNKGKAQDVAPNFVAGDKKSPSNDLQIHVGISCQRCHRKGGLQPIDNWAKSFFPPPLELKLPKIEQARLFREQYGRDLTKRLERDRMAYTDAIFKWTGWTPEEFADKIAAEWDRYENMRVDTDKLAALLNTTPGALVKAIDATVRANNADRILSAVVIAGQSVPIRQIEDRSVVAHLALRGLQPP